MNEQRIPALTLGWRLKMALGDIQQKEMGEHLGVSRATMSRWMNDVGAPPARAYILQWAMRTGVDAKWLETGVETGPTNPGGGAVSSTRRYLEPVTTLRFAA